MSAKNITVHVKMDRRTLRSFALFDTFILRKRWMRPAIFGGIFLIFALICFLATDKEQNTLLGVVMLLIALGMPSVYVGMFLSGVKKQAKKLRLDPPRAVYTLILSEQSVTIHNDLKAETDVTLPWDKLPAAFRVRRAIYLYAAPTRAFILPDGQADAPQDEVWQRIVDHVPTGRAKVAKG